MIRLGLLQNFVGFLYGFVLMIMCSGV